MEQAPPLESSQAPLAERGAGGVAYRDRIRSVLDSLLLHLHPTRVPAAALRFTHTWGLGGISATLTLLLILSGVLLMFRYQPTVDGAYRSILIIETQVAFGSLFRALHHWAANALVIVVFLHMFRVFFTGGYKRGRALNWMIGVGLLVLVLLFNFTGYLLPWDQLAYWGITVVTSLVSYVPVIGREVSAALLAGPEVGQGALSNFYALHVAGLPAVAALLLGYHFWRVRKDGGIALPEGAELRRVTTVPHLVRRELAVFLVVIAAMVLWSMAVPAPLGEMANPMRSPNPAKAAWYLAGFQELLLHMDALAAIFLVLLMLAGVLLLPHLDRRDARAGIYFRSRAGRRAALMGLLLSIDLVPLLIIADEFWIDWMAWLPSWPTFIATGLAPLVLILLGLAGVYGALRLALRCDHSEALVGLFAFVMTSFVLLTITCTVFRGPNMALMLPF